MGRRKPTRWEFGALCRASGLLNSEIAEIVKAPLNRVRHLRQGSVVPTQKQLEMMAFVVVKIQNQDLNGLPQSAINMADGIALARRLYLASKRKGFVAILKP